MAVSALDGALRKVSPSKRAGLIYSLAELIKANGAELAELESLDNGKPLAAAKGDIEALKALQVPGTGRTVAEEITQAIAVIGENINLRRTAYLEVSEGTVAGYLHNQLAPGLGKLGVLVALESTGDASRVG